ncbi:hypothetical protein [Corynebacterium striatum]|uniref:VG15 protein n=1 Tax=Corynebacterium striatum TaxID=43770 RepID=UPI003AD0C993|nr:hypothetical protein [Corynebacterium striatum]
MKGIRSVYAAIEMDTLRLVSEAVAQQGVPPTLEAAEALAQSLFPSVLELRRSTWAREAALISAEFPTAVVPESRPYPFTALLKLIRNSAGLSPKPKLMQLELFDPLTVSMQVRRVAPAWVPGEEAAVEEMKRRLSAGVARHTKQASRDLVFDVSERNHIKYARRLSGAENCSFCALMASRGAVYTSERAAGGDGNFFHDHCDCWVELVKDESTWEGREEAKHYEDMWNEAFHGSPKENMKKFGQLFRAEQKERIL